MYKINFNHLYYFLTIAEQGSIVKAAKKLHITQPALSHQLKLLEDDLGEKLFDRVGRRLELNDTGKSVKEYATRIFRQSEEMLQFVKSGATNIINTVKIGTVPWLSSDEVYDIIRPLLLSKYVRVELFQYDLNILYKNLQEKKLDLVLCDSPYSGRSKKLKGQRLNTSKIFCVAAKKINFKGKFPECLNGKRIINYSENCMISDKVDYFLEQNKLDVHIVGSFTDSTLLRVATERGGVVSFLPENVVKQSIKAKKLYKLGELKNVKFSLWAITHKKSDRESLVNKILN